MIVDSEEVDFQREFKNIENYCLSKEDITILEICKKLVIKSQKNNFNYISKDIDKINNVLEFNKFMPVKFLSENNRVEIRKNVNRKYTFFSLVIVSIILSLFYVIINELYKQNKKEVK